MHAAQYTTTPISRALKRAPLPHQPTASLSARKGLVLQGLVRHPRATDLTQKRKTPGQWSEHAPARDGGSDPRNRPLGCGVTVTDWRLYTADHRQHIDGSGNQNAARPVEAIAG